MSRRIWFLIIALSFIWLIDSLPIAVAQEKSQTCVTARSFLSGAQKALVANDSPAALSQLNRAVELNPLCADAYLLLGLTEFHGGETSKAIEHYKKALKLAPGSYSAHYDLALAYLKESDLQDARLQLELAVALDPKQADAAYDLGIVLLQMNQPADALPHLRRARAMNPSRADVSFNIIRAELEAGRLSAARHSAQEQARHFASDFQWNAAVGQIFLKHTQPGQAAVYLQTAHLIRAEDEDVRNQLAAAYLALRQPENVLHLISTAKTANDHYLRGTALFQLHRFSEADTESDAAMLLDSNDPKVLVLRARLLQRAGEQNAALEMAQKASQLAPGWDEPFYLAGISHYFNRQYAQARQCLARAFELNPALAAAVFVEGLAWANEGNPEQAKKSIQQAIALQPDNARFHCHLGIIILRENQYEHAEEFFLKSIELKPQYALPHYELGKLRMQLKQWHRAADELDKAITLDPGLTSAHYQLARVYAKLGERDKAARALAEFQKLHRQELDESSMIEEDARQESDPR